MTDLERQQLVLTLEQAKKTVMDIEAILGIRNSVLVRSNLVQNYIELIIFESANYFNVPLTKMKEEGRTKNLVWARFAAVYFIFELTSPKPIERVVCEAFNRELSWARYAHQEIKNRCLTDKHFREQLSELETLLKVKLTARTSESSQLSLDLMSSVCNSPEPKLEQLRLPV